MALLALSYPLHLVSFGLLVLATTGPRDQSFEAGLPFFVPFLFLSIMCAAGTLAFTSHMRRNARLSPQSRRRWIATTAAMPYAGALYWWLEVRPVPPPGRQPQAR